MSHIILLGDSIFDNGSYVVTDQSVSDHLRHLLASADSTTQVSLLAVDGSYINDVSRQLSQVPKDATHLFVSIGGNDALSYATQLDLQAPSRSLLGQVERLRNEFETEYRDLLKQLLSFNLPLTMCTIYDHCPMISEDMRLLLPTVLPVFNDCITRQVIAHGLPLIDLRVVCSDQEDYVSLFPIEPSEQGGLKIARRILQVFNHQDFSQEQTVAYG